MVKARLGENALRAVVRLANRKQGLTCPELQERYDVKQYTAWRYLNKLVKMKFLKRDGSRRNRPDLFDVYGPGGIVYRATKKRVQETSWENWQTWRRNQARKSRTR